MSAMANATSIVTTVTKTTNKEKASNATHRVNIQDFCEEHYEDILPIIMEKARRDKRKKVQTRLNFEENSKKTRRERENSLNSRVENSPTRFHPERSRTRGRERRDVRNVFSRANEGEVCMRDLVIPTRQVQQSPGRAGRTREIPPTVEVIIPEGNVPELKNTPGAPKSRMVILTLRGPRPSIEIDLVTEIDSEATKRRELVDEDDMAVPWTCEDVDPFTPRIRNFKSSRKTGMPNNVKTYEETGDPGDHLKIFQAAAQVEQSIDGYKGLKAAFLAYFMQQKKYVKDPVEIHNIKQRDRETIEDFIERFKVEIGRMKGAPECMWISGFMHGVNNLELTKLLNTRSNIPKLQPVQPQTNEHKTSPSKSNLAEMMTVG
ncbi:reverse transcriptase domain-containing protein [Tanacetum coccineum]